MNSRFLELLNTNKGQKKKREAEKITYALECYADKYSKENNKDVYKIPMKYVTHTDKEIVFLIDNNLVLINQPNNKDIYTNMTNLLKLNRIDDSIVTVNDYIKFNGYELLELNYNKEGLILTDDMMLKNVRNGSLMGLNNELKTYIALTTINNLLYLYDFEKSLGLSNIKLNDFVLDQSFYKDKDVDSLHLYNVREISEMSFNDYLDQIKKMCDGKFSKDDIEEGISLSKKLKKVSN